MHTRLFALLATVGLVLFALGPGVATVAAQEGSLDVSVEQVGNDGPTVTVTENETAVGNVTVGVAALDNTSYAGAGNYTTDENGTVSLPAPETNATIEVTATYNNTTVSESEDLSTVAPEEEPENASFGSDVSAFVHSLIHEDEGNVGQQVSAFVVANNPGNAPDHAGPPAGNQTGPPEDAGPENAGPPADVGPDTDDNETDRRGPPENAGPSGDNETDDRRGPPADIGPGSDEVETDDGNETEDDDRETEEVDEEDDEDDDDADDDDGGPPENPGNARGN